MWWAKKCSNSDEFESVEQCSNSRLCVATGRVFCKTVGGVAIVAATRLAPEINVRAIWACKTETLPKPHIKQTSEYLWVNFLSNQALCTVQWNNAQIPDCVWPLAACFVKQWEAWPWWQPQDNFRPPWPLVSTRTPRESHFMLFKTASETRVNLESQPRFEFQVWHSNLISTLWKWSNLDFNVFLYLSWELPRKPSKIENWSFSK